MTAWMGIEHSRWLDGNRKQGLPTIRSRTCGAIVQKCQVASLFPSFCAEAFKASGTVRNELGSAHGRGPTRKHRVSMEQADHMIQMTSAHITDLVTVAGV